MVDAIPLDRAWLAAHPLVAIPDDTDKNARGHVLIVGGSLRAPGALRLTAEAAFRAGAGKVRIATLASLAVPLGIAVPEAGIIALPESGDEIAADAVTVLAKAIGQCDTLVIGPGMLSDGVAGALLDGALEVLSENQVLLLDAAAIRAARERVGAIKRAGIRCVLTPHAGEMAGLLDEGEAAIRADPAAAVLRAIAATGQTALIKGPVSFVGGPDCDLLGFAGGGPGLATGGSGDVLAGLVAAFLARGQDPLSAAAWGVWLHGEAGRRLAERQGAIGFLARELIPPVPGLIAGFG